MSGEPQIVISEGNWQHWESCTLLERIWLKRVFSRWNNTLWTMVAIVVWC